MAKKKTKKLVLTIQTKVSIKGAGEFIIAIKLDGDSFLGQYGDRTDAQIKRLFLQGVESEVMHKLKTTPLKGELVKAVSRLRKEQAW